jgi:hypothetical protein
VDPYFCEGLDVHDQFKMPNTLRLFDEHQKCSPFAANPFKQPRTKREAEVQLQYESIQSHLRLHPTIRTIADQLVEKVLGGKGNFISLHFRGKEFDQFDAANGGWVLAEYIKRVEICAQLNTTTKLYVATDVGKKFFGEGFPKGAKYLRAVFIEDLEPYLASVPERKQQPEKWPKLVSFVETAVAASARVFIGTKFSTFTDEITHLQQQQLKGRKGGEKGNEGTGGKGKGHRPLYHQEYEQDKADKEMCSSLAQTGR